MYPATVADQQDSPTRRRILVLDDEPNIVNALRRELTLRPFGRHRFEVETFTDPLRALTRAATQEFEVVLADYRMPGMDGLAFLKAFSALQPDCVRIVISGQTDFKSLVSMINDRNIYCYVAKPWNSQLLLRSIDQAIDTRDGRLENRRLADVLRRIGVALPDQGVKPVDQILVLDPDIDVAQAAARCLQRGGADLDPARIEVRIASSPQRALKLADTVTFSCAIADHQTSGMNGARFLADLHGRQPDCTCILMSGAWVMDGLVTALDLAHVQAFIAKPWTDSALRGSVARVLDRRRLLLENRVLAQMCRARDLATLE